MRRTIPGGVPPMRKSTLCLLSLAVLGSSAAAAEWKIIGTRAQGMGGAHVAVADDATASHWNPAGYAKLQGHQTRVEVGANLQVDPDLFERAEDIFDFIDLIESSGTPFDQVLADLDAGNPVLPADLQQVLNVVADGFRLFNTVNDLGGLASANANLMMNFGRFGGGVNLMATIEATAQVDLDPADISLSNSGTAQQNVENVFDPLTDRYPLETEPQNAVSDPIRDIFIAGGVATNPDELAEDMVWNAEQAGLDIYDPATQQVLFDMATALAQDAGPGIDTLIANNTSIIVKGVLLKEAVVTYGHPFADGKLCLGFNLKAVEGETYYRVLPYDEFGTAEDLLDEILDEKNRESSTTVALDVGILYQPFEKVRFGLVAKNLNGPEFDFASGGDYELDPQARLGVAFFPAKRWTIAADIEVTENVIEGVTDFDTRFLSVGTEIQLARLLSLRAGANLNLADSGLDELYTVGLGIGAGSAFRLDLAVALAGDREDLDLDYDLAGFDLPSGLGLSVGLQISTKF